MNSTSLTPLEVAELLKITKNTVYELIKRGNYLLIKLVENFVLTRKI